MAAVVARWGANVALYSPRIAMAVMSLVA